MIIENQNAGTIINEVINLNDLHEETFENWAEIFDNQPYFARFFADNETSGKFYENRKDEIKKIDIEKYKVHCIFGLPKIGKTVFMQIWIDGYLKDNNTGYCYITYDPEKKEENDKHGIKSHKYLCENAAKLLEAINGKDGTYIIIFDDIEKIDDRQKSQLTRFVESYRDSNISRLKLFFIAWEDMKDRFPLDKSSCQSIQLIAYNIEQYAPKFKKLNIDDGQFENLKRIYGGHNLLLNHALDLLSDKEMPYTYADLIARDSMIDLYEKLKGAIHAIFKKITNNQIVTVFQEVVLSGRILDSHNRRILNKLCKLSLLERNGDGYIIHHFILDLAKEYYRDENNIENFKTTGINLIKKLTVRDCKNGDDSVIREAISAFVFLKRIGTAFDRNTLDYFKRKYKDDYSIILCLLSNNAALNKQALEDLKDILDDDIHLYEAVNYKQLGQYVQALDTIEQYKTEKESKKLFDKNARCRYWFEKGNILKQIDPQSNRDEIISCLTKALENRDNTVLGKIRDSEDNIYKKSQLKTFMLPAIDLASIYLSQIKEVIQKSEIKSVTDPDNKDLIDKTRDLLYKNYVLLEFYKLHEQHAPIYITLGSFYRTIGDDYKAKLCYEQANKIKTNYNSLFYLSNLELQNKNFKKAHELLEKGMKNNVFMLDNYIINRNFGISLREEKQYEESLTYLRKSLQNIKKLLVKGTEKFEIETGKTVGEIFYTLIKQARFEEIEKEENYAVYKDLLDNVVKRKDLLYNIDNGEKIKIIKFILAGYKNNAGLKKTCENLYSKGCKIISNPKSNSSFFQTSSGSPKYGPTDLYNFIKENGKFNLYPQNFNDKERETIATQLNRILSELSGSVNDNDAYGLYLLQYVRFQHGKMEHKKSLLKNFFRQNKYTGQYQSLFQAYKDICIALERMDFLDVYQQNEADLIETLKYDFGKMAHVFLRKKDNEKAGHFFQLAVTHAPNYHNYLDYAVFNLSICNFGNFWNYYDKSIEYHSKQKQINLTDSKSFIDNILRIRLNSCKFHVSFDKKTDYTQFLEKNRETIRNISRKFKFDLKLKIMIALLYFNKGNKRFLLFGVVFHQKWAQKWSAAKESFDAINSKKWNKAYKAYEECQQKIIEMENDFNNGNFDSLPAWKKLIFANRFFDAGNYQKSFTLYNKIIVDSSSSHIDIQDNDSLLENYIYCLSYLKQQPDYNSLSDNDLLVMGKKYSLQNDIRAAFRCIEACLKKTANTVIKSDANYFLAKLYNGENKFEKALNHATLAVDFACEALIPYCQENKLPKKTILIHYKTSSEEHGVDKIKDLLSKSCCLQAILLFEAKNYYLAFKLFNRTYLKTGDKRLLIRKTELISSLKEEKQQEFQYEIDYNSALEGYMEEFRRNNNPSGVARYYSNAIKAFQNSKRNYNIMEEILEINRTFKGSISVECVELIRNTYLHFYDNDNFSLWMNLGTLFKETGQVRKAEKEKLEMYMYAQVFYNRMQARTNQEYFYFHNNMTLLFIAKANDGIFISKDISKEHFYKAKLYAGKCTDKERLLEYMKKTQEDYENAIEKNESLNCGTPETFYLNEIDMLIRNLSKLSADEIAREIKVGSLLKCKLKLIYNYGFFFTHIIGNGYIDGLLHKNTFKKKIYLFNILRRIKPGGSSNFTLAVKCFREEADGGNPVFEPSPGFEQEVWDLLNDYIVKNKNNILDLSNLELKSMPEINTRLQSVDTLNIDGNSLEDIRLDFFDKMPGLQIIQYDTTQKELVEKLQSCSEKLAKINWIEVYASNNEMMLQPVNV